MNEEIMHISDLTTRLRDEVFNYLDNMVGCDINKLLDVVISSHISSMTMCAKIIGDQYSDKELTKTIDDFISSLYMFLTNVKGMSHEKFTVHDKINKTKQ